MPLSLDLPTILGNTNTLCGLIPNIREAFNYDSWPQRPPGMPNARQAYHLTGLPGTDGTTIGYNIVGMDLSEYVLEVPLYTIIADPQDTGRAALWMAPYISAYPDLFRDHIYLGNTATGLANALVMGGAYLEQRGTIVRAIPDWPGFNGFFILRWVLTVHVKGAHTNAPSG